MDIDEEEQTSLSYACGDLTMFKLLENKIHIKKGSVRKKRLTEITDGRNNTLLHDAARFGNVDLIKYLINSEFELERRNYDSYTPLHLAVIAEKKSAVKTLVKAGADINSKTYGLLNHNGGYTALHLAVENLLPEIVETLLSFGADRNAQNERKLTPLELLDKVNKSPMINQDNIQQIRNSLNIQGSKLAQS